MKTNFENFYKDLSPAERFSLIVDAGSRGDSVEQDRIYETARKLTFQFPDHHGYALGFMNLLNYYVTSQLELIARDHLIPKICRCISKEHNEEEDLQEGFDMFSLMVYGFQINEAAFEKVCGEYDIEAAALLAAHQSFPVLELAKRFYGAFKYPKEHADEVMQRVVDDKEIKAITVDNRVLIFRAILNEVVEDWSY